MTSISIPASNRGRSKRGNPMYTIRLAGSLWDDMTSCMESLQTDVENGHGEAGDSEWCKAFWASTDGTITLENDDALRAMSRDVEYRRDFNQPRTHNKYGNRYPSAGVRRAADSTLSKIDQLLKESA